MLVSKTFQSSNFIYPTEKIKGNPLVQNEQQKRKSKKKRKRIRNNTKVVCYIDVILKVNNFSPKK